MASNEELAKKVRDVLFAFPGESLRVYEAMEALGTLVERATRKQPVGPREIDKVEDEAINLLSPKRR